MPVGGLTFICLFIVAAAGRGSVQTPALPLTLSAVRLAISGREARMSGLRLLFKEGAGVLFLPHPAQPSARQLCKSGQLAGEVHFLGPRLPSYLWEP